MKKTLQYERFEQILHNIQNSRGQGEIFLKLLENAKQAASDDITENCPEYNAAWNREMELMDKVSNDEDVKKRFNRYVNAAEETNTIWAEEMYLRGIQDAVLFIGMLTGASVPVITGIIPEIGNT